jgi:two-component system, OmpR family, phosphate regulon response regulator PhoB
MARILVIEDDRSLRDLLRVHLGARGHNVRLAADAAEGIRSILDSVPDIILCDVMMPYMDGLELLKALRGDDISRDIPVVLLTARTDDETWIEAMKLGVQRYVTKPVQLTELMQAVEWALKAAKARGGTVQK